MRTILYPSRVTTGVDDDEQSTPTHRANPSGSRRSKSGPSEPITDENRGGVRKERIDLDDETADTRSATAARHQK